MTASKRKVIDLALQGGGAHGAFTWGVLDRLLEDGRVEIEAISGTSAGAMNGAVVADGLCRGGNDAAREALEKLWLAVSSASQFSLIRRSPLDMLFGSWSLDWSPGYLAADALSRILTPYDFNPLGVNPLRDIVKSQVDFDHINHNPQLKLFVTATNVRTGRPKIFRPPDITVEALMASACIPALFKAVEIDGEAYWDGGFMGNPALFPLVDECKARDLVIVQINPIYREKLPRTAPEIADRINEITYNASLMKELRSLGFLSELIRYENLEWEGYRDARLHRIHADSEMMDLGVSSKLNAEWEFLTYLRDIGRGATERWLEEHYEDVGNRTTFDLSFLLEDSLQPAHPPGDEPMKPDDDT